MRTLFGIIVAIILLFPLRAPAQGSYVVSGKAVDSRKETKEVVTVYYFHGERRCVTCVNIQNITRDAVSDVFGKDERVVFKEINLEHQANRSLVERYKISWSSLIVQGPREYADLTAQAFRNARNAGKLREIVVSTVKGYLP